MGGQHPPVTEDDRDAVRRLHAEGLGRNEIARQIGRAQRTVSVIAAELGLDFDRTMTAVATQARVIDGKARRAALVQRSYARAEKLYDRLEADESDGYQYTAVTSKGIETRCLDHVPGIEERAIAQAAGQYLTHAAKLEAIDADSGSGEVGSLLTSLFDRLRDRHGDS
ncbi:helix-turn-helix domain-containing protein [Streptomyces sp. NPDC001985]|uniref:helix-turn-helix domain-containing protein n=1 Tax=Streptomyces sp. NPDC001985 TaxID=3154406 RepID=UPI00331E736A